MESNSSVSRLGNIKPQRIHALIVGVGKYDSNPEWALPESAESALRFADQLIKMHHVSAQNVHLFLSTPNEKEIHKRLRAIGLDKSRNNATSNAVTDFIDRKLCTLKGDLLVCYVAGHGCLIPPGRRLLLLEDWNNSECQGRLLNLDDLLWKLIQSPFGGNFPFQDIYVDACSEIMDMISVTVDYGRGRPKAGPIKTTQSVLYACNKDQYVESGHFTGKLLEAFRAVSGKTNIFPDPDRVSGWMRKNCKPTPERWEFICSAPQIRNWYMQEDRFVDISSSIRSRICQDFQLLKGFTGRSEYRATLTKWLTDSGSVFAILESMPKAGSTSLAWVWLHEDVLHQRILSQSTNIDQSDTKTDDCLLDGVFWWSFDQEPNFHNFYNELLKFLHPNSELSDARTSDPIDVIVNELRHKRFLIILDGFDALLTPPGFSQSKVANEYGSPSKPQCSLPITARFLRSLVSRPAFSRVLITCMQAPCEIADSELCSVHSLNYLDPDESSNFLSSLGVLAPQHILQSIARIYHNRPLVLRAVAEWLCNNPDQILSAVAQPASLELGGWFSAIYDSLSEENQAALMWLSAVQGPISFDLGLHLIGQISMKRRGQIAATSSFEKPAATMRYLTQRGIVIHGNSGNYMISPDIQEFVLSKITDDVLKKMHECIIQYIEPTTIHPPESIAAEEETGYSQSTFLHMTALGRYEEAFEFFRAHLTDLFYICGSYHTVSELLEHLFKPETLKPLIAHVSHQLWCIDMLSCCYYFTGRARDAITAWRKGAEYARQAEESRDHCLFLRNIGLAELQLGGIEQAKTDLSNAVRTASEINDKYWQQCAMQELAFVLAVQGNLPEAKSVVKTIESLFGPSPSIDVCKSRICLLYGDKMSYFDSGMHALDFARRAKESIRDTLGAMSLYQKNDIILLELIARICALVKKGLAGSASLTNEISGAMNRARAQNWLEHEAALAIAGARLYIASGNPDAVRLIEESIFLCERSGFIIQLIEALIMKSYIQGLAGNSGKAMELAKRAIELARRQNCSYMPGIRRAELLLSGERASEVRIEVMSAFASLSALEPKVLS